MLVDSSNSAAGSAVTGAIRQASQATGTSFNYLLATAQVELGLNPQAGAPTSSARGLFQFIQQTWLATMKQAGPALGYGRLCGCDLADRDRPIPGERPDAAQRDSRAAQRSDGERGDGRRLHQGQHRIAERAARPFTERGRTLYRALSRRRRCGASHQHGREQSECQSRGFFPRRRAGQFADLL